MVIRMVPAFILYAVLASVTHAADPSAPQYPGKPLRVIVPFAAGTAWDVRVRQLADTVSKSVGQPVVVENRPGAGGTLGAQVVAKSPADGYTILAGGIAELAVAPAVYATLSYDPRHDFAPITQVVFGSMILVVAPSLEVKSIEELVTLAKRQPGQLTAASYGNGTLSHLLITELGRTTGTNIVHVPYKSAPEALTDLVAGRVSMMFDFYTTSGQFIQTGKLRPLLVATARRHRALPDTPTASEVGLPTLTHQPWGGFLAPAGTPKPIIERLNREFVKAALAPSFKQSVEAAGADVVGSTPDEFAALIRKEQDDFVRLAKESGVKLE